MATVGLLPSVTLVADGEDDPIESEDVLEQLETMAEIIAQSGAKQSQYTKLVHFRNTTDSLLQGLRYRKDLIDKYRILFEKIFTLSHALQNMQLLSGQISAQELCDSFKTRLVSFGGVIQDSH